jgi:hypothetical protein
LQDLFYGDKGHTALSEKMSESEIIDICKHLVEKNGIPGIERITGHHRDTIGRLLEDMAEQAEEMNEHLIKNLGLTPFECDELWSFIEKAPFGCKSIVARAKHWMVPIS